MIDQHHELFSTYWAWAEDWLAWALDHGIMWTHMDWRCVVGDVELKTRSIINWPVQSLGGDILRMSCIWATQARVTAVRADPRCDPDRGADRPHRSRRRASPGHHGARVLSRARRADAAHRREDHPLSGPLHRQPRRRDLGPRHRSARAHEGRSEMSGQEKERHHATMTEAELGRGTSRSRRTGKRWRRRRSSGASKSAGAGISAVRGNTSSTFAGSRADAGLCPLPSTYTGRQECAVAKP